MRGARAVGGEQAGARRGRAVDERDAPAGALDRLANRSPEMAPAGPKRAAAVGRPREVGVGTEPIVRGTITSTMSGAGSSTETRERL